MIPIMAQKIAASSNLDGTRSLSEVPASLGPDIRPLILEPLSMATQ